MAGLAGKLGGNVELPDVELPKVELPEVDLPKVALPEVDLPKVELPEVELPKVELPEVELPKVELPDVDLPKVELPEVELPKVELPDVALDSLKGKVTGGLDAAGGLVAGLAGKLGGDVELPEVELPKVELPDLELPKVELPDVDLPKVELPEVELPKVKLPEVDLPKVELPKVELPEVELPKVELPEVDWPGVSARVGEVEADLSSVSLPHVGAELPDGGVKLPQAAIDVLAPTAAGRVKTDDLTLVPGIGPKYAAQLAAAGITSYAALSAAKPEQLKAIIDVPAWRRVDTDAWVTGAQTLLSKPLAARSGDDLTLLEGIGPVYAGKLNAAGITSFADLAAADEAGLSAIIQAPAWRRVNYGDWIAQARLAAAGDEAGLQALQAVLFSRQGDNLNLVSGVGEKTAQALGAAGITTFSALAAANPEQLAQITRTAGVRGGDYDAWIKEAKLRASGKRITRMSHSRSEKTVSCPQDLSRVQGIGSVYEQKLYAAGIGSFWELAQSDDAALKSILDLKEFQDVDLAAIKADALRLAEETGTIGRKWDGAQPDDFEPFEGIGEVYEGRLYDAGICTYRALANATVEQLAAICQAPEWRKPSYKNWIAQAKRLLDQEA